MFKSLGLLSSLPCPDLAEGECGLKRVNCPFSHRPSKQRLASPPSAPSAAATTPSPSSSSLLPAKAKSAGIPSVSSKASSSAVVTTAVKRAAAPSASSSSVSAPPAAKKAKNAYNSAVVKTSASPSSVGSSVAGPSSAPRSDASSSSAAGSGSVSTLRSSRPAGDGWSNVPIPPPTITFKQHPTSSQIPLNARQGALKTLYASYNQVYAPFLGSTNSVVRSTGQRLARDHSLAQELQIFKDASKVTYKNSSVTILVGLKKRDAKVLEEYASRAEKQLAALQADSAAVEPGMAEKTAMTLLEACPETGTALQVRAKQSEAEARVKGELSRHRLAQAGFICPKGDLEKHGFMVEIPDDWKPHGGSRPDSVGEIKECDRCGKSFRVGGEMNEQGTERIPQDQQECRYHHGRKRYERTPGSSGRVQTWLCCGRPVGSSILGDDSCCLGPHVFKEQEALDLHKRESFITTAELTASLSSEGAPMDHLDIVALDCELSFTTAGMSLTRLTLISEEGKVILDELVRTQAQIIDFNTRFSGIHKEEYERDAVLDLSGVRRAMGRFVGEKTILVGHGLENDLRALRLVHTTVVDTALLFQHPRGPPYRMALRTLTSTHLGKIIQSAGASVGHSSAEDAQMALELVRWKMVNDAFSPFSQAAGGSNAEGAKDTGKSVVKGVSV